MHELQQLIDQADRLQQQIDAHRPMEEASLRSLRDYYRVGLTYTSNALEGNSLTLSETKVVIEDGLTVAGHPLRELYEAEGHAKAYDHLQRLTTGAPLLQEDILTLHRLFYQQIDAAQAGRYREVEVYVSGSQYPVSKAADIDVEMRRLVQWYNEHEGRQHPILLAAELHRRFVFIHPFIDGNGRVARLLMNMALLRGGYNIALIPSILRSEYIACLERVHEDAAPFHAFIARQVVSTQQDLLRLMQ